MSARCVVARSLVFVVLVLGSSVQLAAQCVGPTCHELGGPISDGAGGPFLSGHVYVIDIASSVPAGTTLTIQPGAVVKFKAWTFAVSGTLLAQGTPAQPIVFTSFLDDSVAGDTNGDGGATSPAPEDWGDLRFNTGSDASVVEHALIRYSGRFDTASVRLNTHGVTLSNVTIQHGADGINSNGKSAQISNCHFDDVESPIINLNANYVDLLLDNTGSASNDDNALHLQANSLPLAVSGNTTWSAANMINGTGGLVVGRDLDVPVGSTLTLLPGVVLKLNTSARALVIRGALNVLGAPGNPVVVTSVHDDVWGSDTSGGTPAPGDWRHVLVSTTAAPCEFRHLVMRYGGQQGAGMLRLDGFATVDDSEFYRSSSSGIGASSVFPPEVRNCSFLMNAGEPITAVPLEALENFSGNVAMGNGAGDVIVLGAGTLTVPATLLASSAFNGTGAFVLEGSNKVGGGGVLSVAPGVIFKAKPGAELRALSGGKVLLGGAGPPVVFTSLQDDTHGGDLNGDGNVTQPAPGDWNGLRAVNADHSSVIDNVLVRYAGGGAISLVSTNLTLSNTTVEHSSGIALSELGQGTPTVTSCAFDNGGGLPVDGFSLPALANFSANTASGNAGGNSLRVVGGNVNTDVTLDPSHTLNQDGVLIVGGTVNVDVVSTLDLQPGMILKFEDDAELSIAFRLFASGSAQDPVVLTSLDDDWGGDTNGDGGAPSQGTPGFWRGLRLLSPSDDSLLTHVFVRNAGSQTNPSVLLENSDAGLDNVTVERGTNVALKVAGGLPAVTNCSFDTHARPVELSTLGALLGFDANTAAGNAQHDSLVLQGQGAQPAGGWAFLRAMTLNASGVLRLHYSPNIGGGATLTIGPGMLLKFNSPDRVLQITAGTLLVQGTAVEPVIFTSIHDDEFGGADSDPTAPAPGDWTGLKFTGGSEASLVEHAVIRYAGHAGAASLVIDDASPSFCFLHIEFGAGSGISITGSSAPNFKNVSIDDNAGDPIEGITWNVLANLQGITAMGNGSDLETVIIDSPVVVGHVTIEQENVFGPCIVVRVTPNIDSFNTLNFGRGLVIKADGEDVALRVRNVHATGQEKTVFTSIHDDTWAGDSNGNGSATLPAPGDWIGLTCTTSSGSLYGGAEVEHALVRYAGASLVGAEPVGLFGNQVLSSRVEFSAGGGVDALDCENVVAFDNALIGIFAESSAVSCTSVRNGELGIRARRSSYCVSWNNGPTLTENFFEVSGPIIGCPPCAADITYSLGTTLGLSPPVQGGPGFFGCPNTGWGNFIADPLFVNEAAGDLRLSANSPARDVYLQPCPLALIQDPNVCTPAGLNAGGQPSPPPGSRDYSENSRRIDATPGQTAGKLADLGAHERVRWTLDVEGPFVMGQPITIEVPGPPGSALIMIGFEAPQDFFLYGWGYLMITPQFLKLLSSIPTNTPVAVGIPVDLGLEGLQGAVQCAVTLTGQPGHKQITNVYRPRFRF